MEKTWKKCPLNNDTCPLPDKQVRPSKFMCAKCDEAASELKKEEDETFVALTCQCCGCFLCVDCHKHGWPKAGTVRSLVVCPACCRTCDARAGVFSHPQRLKRDRDEALEAPAVSASSSSASAAAAAAAAAAAVSLEMKPGANGTDSSAPRKRSRGANSTSLTTPRQRGRGAAMRKFMPPLPPKGSPLKMMLQNIIFTVYFGVPVLLDHVNRELLYRGSEFNGRRFCAVITRTHESVPVARPAYLNRLGSLAPVATKLTEKHIRCGETTPFLPPVADIPRVQELQHPSTRRTRISKAVILLFNNGHAVCTGARDLEQARSILSKFAEKLRGIGYKQAEVRYINVRNMVGSAQLSCRISREALAKGLAGYATYDPKQFPGVRIKGHPLIRPCTLSVFQSGRVVVTGPSTKASADAALARFHHILLHFDVNTPSGTPMPNVSGNDMAPYDESMEWALAVTSTDAYMALGVQPTASMRTIRRRWRIRMLQVHPDKFGDVPAGSYSHRVLTAETRYVQDLFELLGERSRRVNYNAFGQGAPVPPASIDSLHADVLYLTCDKNMVFATRDAYLQYKRDASDGAAASTSVHEEDDVDETEPVPKAPDLPDYEDDSDDDGVGLDDAELDDLVAKAQHVSDDESDASDKEE